MNTQTLSKLAKKAKRMPKQVRNLGDQAEDAFWGSEVILTLWSWDTNNFYFTISGMTKLYAIPKKNYINWIQKPK